MSVSGEGENGGVQVQLFKRVCIGETENEEQGGGRGGGGDPAIPRSSLTLGCQEERRGNLFNVQHLFSAHTLAHYRFLRRSSRHSLGPARCH